MDIYSLAYYCIILVGWCVMRNYTVMFLMLVVASITGGMALKGVYDYSMLVGVGLAFLFLLCSALSLSKNKRKTKT